MRVKGRDFLIRLNLLPIMIGLAANPQVISMAILMGVFFVLNSSGISHANHNDSEAFVEDPAINGCNHYKFQHYGDVFFRQVENVREG